MYTNRVDLKICTGFYCVCLNIWIDLKICTVFYCVCIKIGLIERSILVSTAGVIKKGWFKDPYSFLLRVYICRVDLKIYEVF